MRERFGCADCTPVIISFVGKREWIFMWLIYNPYLSVDTVRPLEDVAKKVLDWFNLAPRYDTIDRWEDPAGAWYDLPDSMLDELDRLRHAVPPTPPLE